MLMFHIYFAKL